MSIWLCDKCGADSVNKKESKPLSKVYRSGEIPWKNGTCERCKTNTSLMLYPINRGDL